MNKRIIVLPFALLFVMFLTLSGVWTPPRASAGTLNRAPFTVHAIQRDANTRAQTANVTLDFNQLHWLNDDGSVGLQFSRVAVAQFSFAGSAKMLLDTNGGGFINVITDIGNGSGPLWTIQNLYLSYPNKKQLTHAHPTVQFGLPTNNGAPVPNLVYAVSLTKKPLDQFIAPPTVPAQVQPRDYLVGGLEQGGSGNSDLPQQIGAWVGCPDVGMCKPNPEKTARILIATNNVAAIDEGKMGCAPSAAARSIKYLKGDSVGDPQGIYDGLKGAMGTSPTTGTTKDNMLEGKRKYTKQNKLKIDTKMVGWSKSGATAVMGSLNSGADVEILIKWNNQETGHAAMVTSITKIDKDHFEVKYVDDPTQGDGKAENQEHVIIVDKDGNFPGGKITHMMVETNK